MTTGRDDDALTWDGDDDPTLDVGASDAGGEVPAAEAASPEPTDTEPTDAEPDAAAGTAVLPEGFTAVGRGSERVSSADAAAGPAGAPADAVAVDGEATAAKTPMGNAELIVLGVLGGVYALFAVGWLIGGLRLQGWRPFLVTDAMYQGSLWLAVLAPVLWFATVFLLTRASRSWVRFAWLAAGVVLLVPWPFVMIGAVGQ
ncbi:DNA polymerase III subunit gamma/tau [Microbacterium cremeum]|uniref:DNA polymerase III subunit gamma/tau n=1 Tax=Microbacterium cremeum TaxID=2782169 RepID=UPI001886C298|nr:DNA polymerase III subunit gamma/tau [Microbacterium cremeum]